MTKFMEDSIATFLEKRREKQEKAWRKGKLHVSSDISGCLRKTCFELADVEKKQEESSLYLSSRQLIGQGLHNWLGKNLKNNYSIKQEVNLSEGLPNQWDGTADFLVEGDNGKWALFDLKITSSARRYYDLKKHERYDYTTDKNSGLPDIEHVWQVSAYKMALEKMGYEIAYVGVVYWFIDQYHHFGQKHFFDPLEIEVDCFSEKEVNKKLQDISSKIDKWKKTEVLPDYMDPIQKIIAKPSWKNPKKYELHQQIHWKEKACPYYNRHCFPPHFEGKIGEWSLNNQSGQWDYTTFQKIEPLIYPPGVTI